MPTSKEILLNVLNKTIESRKDALSSFQIKCLNMFKEKIESIPIDEKTEMDLRICGVLMDQCFCDFHKMFGSEHRIISLANKDNVNNDVFYEIVNKIFDDEISNLNKHSSDSFYDQTFKAVKAVLINMKNELSQLKTALDERLNDASTLSYAEFQLKYGPKVHN